MSDIANIYIFSDLVEGTPHASWVFVLLSLLTQKEDYSVGFLHSIHIIFPGCHSVSVRGALPDFPLPAALCVP